MGHKPLQRVQHGAQQLQQQQQEQQHHQRHPICLLLPLWYMQALLVWTALQVLQSRKQLPQGFCLQARQQQQVHCLVTVPCKQARLLRLLLPPPLSLQLQQEVVQGTTKARACSTCSSCMDAQQSALLLLLVVQVQEVEPCQAVAVGSVALVLLGVCM